jgi:hypothetical protein
MQATRPGDRVGLKKPAQKTHPKKPKKPALKKPKKPQKTHPQVFFWVF